MSTVQLGRLALGPPSTALVEPVGDPVGELGGAVVAAPRTPMQMQVDLNTILTGQSSLTDAQAVRRQLRSMLNNTPLKQQCFIYFQYVDDPEHNGWVIPAPTTLNSPDANAWKAVGLWQTSNAAWYLAGRKRGMREARSVWMKDLRTGNYERDTLEYILSADFAAQPALLLTSLPNGATQIQNNVSDQSLAAVGLPAGRDGGICQQVFGQVDLSYLSFERSEQALNQSDVVVYDRRGNTVGPYYYANVIEDKPVSYWRLNDNPPLALDQMGANPLTFIGTQSLNLYSNPEAQGGVAGYIAGTGNTVAQLNAPLPVALLTNAQGAFQVTAGGTNAIALQSSTTTPFDGSATPGTVYSASAYILAGSTTRSFNVTLSFYNSSGALLSSTTGSNLTDSTTAWIRPSVTNVTAPPTTAYFLVIVSSTTTPANGELHYVSGIQATATSTLQTYSPTTSYTTQNPGALSGGGDSDFALWLDGEGGQLNTSFAQSLNPSGAFTVEAWVNLSRLPASSAYIVQSLVGSTGYRLYCGSTGSADFQVWGGNNHATAVTAAGALVPGTWAHIVGVYDGATARVYVNGGTAATVAFNAYSPNRSSQFYIGGPSFFPGQIDEVAFYNYALTPIQVANHYAAGVSYDGGNQWEEAYGPDYPWSWTLEGGVADAPVLSNGLVRVRYDSAVASRPGFRIDIWTPNGTANGTPGWVEQGKLRTTNGTALDNTWQSANLIEYTPDRVVMLAVMNASTVALSRERVYFTLQRGALGVTVEVYPSMTSTGTPSDTEINWSPALNSNVADLNNSLFKIDSVGATSTTIAAGSSGVNVNTFTGTGVLNVASTTGFAASGELAVPTTGGTALITYTGTTSTTFTGCTVVGGALSGTFTTGDQVAPALPASSTPGAAGVGVIAATAGTGAGTGNSGMFSSTPATLGNAHFKNSENWVANLRCPSQYNVVAPYQVTFVTLQAANSYLQYKGSDTNNYNVNDNYYFIRSQNAAGYLQTQIIFTPTQADQINEAESFRNAGSASTAQRSDIAALANPSAAPTGVVAAGGSVPTGTYYYVYTAVNAAGETTKSATSAAITTTTGNQTVNLTLTAVTGAVAYAVYRGTASGGPFSYLGSTATTSYSDTAAATGTKTAPTTNNTGQTSSGATFVSDTQTASTNATLTKASNLLQGTYRAWARVRVDPGVTGSFTWSMGTPSTAVTTTSTSWVWLDLGELTSAGANPTLSFNDWISAGAALVGGTYIDRVELVLVQDRARTNAIYTGSRDQAQAALVDSRTIGALAVR